MRSIPIALMGHYAGGVTSVCKLVKMRLRNNSLLTFTTADHTIRYTDGPDGELTYSYANGVDPSAFDQSASMAVDNAVLTGIISANGITEQQIRAGLFNGARFWVYQVNYLDLSMGHFLWASGKCGQTKFGNNSFRVEMRSKTQSLKQPIFEAYTVTCPIEYGSLFCGKEFEWFQADVDTVGSEEPDRIFSVIADSNWPDDDRFKWGIVRAITGDNAGIEIEVEVHDGTDIELLLDAPYPFEPDDLLEFRIDCNKEARDTVYGCKSELRWGDDWIYHHRGFPDIPVADQDNLRFPGAQTPFVPGGPVTPVAD